MDASLILALTKAKETLITGRPVFGGKRGPVYITKAVRDFMCLNELDTVGEGHNKRYLIAKDEGAGLFSLVVI